VKNRKLLLIPLAMLLVLSMVAVLALMVRGSGPPPPFAFLANAKPDSVKTLRATNGEFRRVAIYTFSKDYKSVLQKNRSQIESTPGWKLSQYGVGPFWREYHGTRESVEFIDDLPTEMHANPVGVSWSPTGPMTAGNRCTVIYTCPGEAFSGTVTSIFDQVRRVVGGP
jgi:hypothetical protein